MPPINKELEEIRSHIEPTELRALKTDEGVWIHADDVITNFERTAKAYKDAANAIQGDSSIIKDWLLAMQWAIYVELLDLKQTLLENPPDA